MGVYDQRAGCYRKFNGRKGVADITACVNGVCFQIEVKFGKDKMSDDQKDFAKDFEYCNGKYIVAKTFCQFVKEFRMCVYSVFNEE